MKRRTMLNLGCAISMIVYPVYAAASASSFVHKMARVTWYAAQVGAGCFCLDRFHSIAMRSLNPCRIIDACWFYRKSAGSYGVATVALLSSGLSGLDTELQIQERFKRRIRNLRKK